ncbi:hypothetical protein CEUSTIGMA_g6235.t1 [Chlamydomonas eustigma]|uniref:Uncharacterized protein n=1 Tax=Chlamydomonas eustigma TaxID=1157962 RepID=A0A250X6U0_9CHLO|nr:hypothetical protein CEUSTIGMA_g6235.t1 [Chlamydomonas eustigma]|eukprot:GAX78798.1 hypothetical protein CEUSTIGMA_g6235.t1 [Chlamydomonas eustigma]
MFNLQRHFFKKVRDFDENEYEEVLSQSLNSNPSGQQFSSSTTSKPGVLKQTAVSAAQPTPCPINGPETFNLIKFEEGSLKPGPSSIVGSSTGSTFHASSFDPFGHSSSYHSSFPQHLRNSGQDAKGTLQEMEAVVQVPPPHSAGIVAWKTALESPQVNTDRLPHTAASSAYCNPLDAIFLNSMHPSTPTAQKEVTRGDVETPNAPVALEDLFGGLEGASAPVPSSAPVASEVNVKIESTVETKLGTVLAPSCSIQRREEKESTLSSEDADGYTVQPRELLIYAVPLIKDKLVFLPVTAWTVDPEEAKTGATGIVKSGLDRIGGAVSSIWNSLKDKDPESWKYKLYSHGQKILESMSAEERLMKNIPKNATKLVVYHPASVEPIKVQEQLSDMTANFCVKSAGKAAAAGIILPVAVGLEVLAVPGIGWFALYQLYKSSVTAAGGQRLKGYLAQSKDVRVNYAADPRMDKYRELSNSSPECTLSTDEIEELCQDLQGIKKTTLSCQRGKARVGM